MNLIAFILLATAAAPTIAAEVLVRPGVHRIDLAPHLEVLEDAKKQWRIEDLQSETRGKRFRSAGGRIPNYGFTRSAYWFRVRLTSEHQALRRVYLHMGHVVFDRMEYFVESRVPRAKGGFLRYLMGAAVPGGGRVFALPDFVVPIDLEPGRPTWIYLRGETEGSMQVPLQLWQDDALASTIATRQTFYGVLYGLLVVLLVYNLLLFAVFREASYGYLSLCVAGAILYLSYFTGIAQAFVVNDSVWWSNMAYPLTMVANLLPAYMFTRRFLDLRQTLPGFDRTLVAAIVLGGLALPLSLVANYRVTMLYVIVACVPGVLVALLSGIVAGVRGHRPARFYIVAWSAFFLGIVVFAVEKLGLLPRSLFTNNAHITGYVVTLLVLPFGLASRINRLRRDKATAQAEALAAKSAAAEELEREVAAKTADLAERNVQLQREIGQRARSEQERAELQRNLFQSQKMDAIGRLAGGVAHDMNNILAVIGLTAQTAQIDAKDNAEVQAALEDVLSAAKRGGNLAKNLLGFARRGRYQMERVSLNKAINEIHRLLRRTLHPGVEIELELTDHRPEVEADPNQIGQIIVNLAVNGAHAMSNSGRLTIRTRVVELDSDGLDASDGLGRGRYACLEVQDTGVGMDEATQARVFEPFFTTKPPGEGTGLGLSMVYGAVEAHGGQVTIDSALGAGTTLGILLPALEPALEPAAAEREARGPTPETPAGAVLIVDDEAMLRRSTCRLLDRLGFGVLEADNGREALEIFERERAQVAVVLLDLVMPEMAGPETFKKMRELDPEVRVVLCSGFSQEGAAEELLSAGAKAFLRKPFDYDDLRRALELALA